MDNNNLNTHSMAKANMHRATVRMKDKKFTQSLAVLTLSSSVCYIYFYDLQEKLMQRVSASISV